MLKGLDVSHYQGKVNWAKLKLDGVEFAFIKATEGLAIVDSMFHDNWVMSEDAKIPRGAYHFFRPNSDPYGQANVFLKTLEEQLGFKSDLPAVLDFEISGTALSHSAQIQNAINWLEVVESSTKKTPILYTNPSLMQEFGYPEAFAKYPLWISHYGVSTPHVPKQWSTWTFWQSSARAEFGPLVTDGNYFNGVSLDALLSEQSAL